MSQPISVQDIVNRDTCEKNRKRQEKIRRPQWNIVTFAASRDECVTSAWVRSIFYQAGEKMRPAQRAKTPLRNYVFKIAMSEFSDNLPRLY